MWSRRAATIGSSRVLKISSSVPLSVRTRSTTRARRTDVDRTSVPLAEISTAGVIIAERISSPVIRAAVRFTTTIVASSSQGPPSPNAAAASNTASRIAEADRIRRTAASTPACPKDSPSGPRRSRIPSVVSTRTSPISMYAMPRWKRASGNGPITVPPITSSRMPAAAVKMSGGGWPALM